MTDWPELPLEAWRDTKETLHRWTQVVGKIRMTLTPLINHWWNVPLYVTARGLTTSEIPYGDRWFDMEFDFIAHVLRVRTNDGSEHDVRLGARSVADLHDEVFRVLRSLDISCRIWTVPVEIDNPIPLDRDEEHSSYDREYVERFWRILALTHAVFTEFRAEFIGKCSPVHFFWGSGDLAVTRFSGRRAPVHPGGLPNMPDPLVREAYSHECSSIGFWPGGEQAPYPFFFAYAYPAPAGFAEARVQPGAARFEKQLGEFVLPYDAVRESADPDATLLAFAQSTYEAAATLGAWDRAALERT
ncbi:MAG: DUF5996 family protein [Thermoanaerobaculia bacterium]